MPIGCLPSTLSTTTLGGHGLASSRSPTSSTCSTAKANAQRYGLSRRRTLETTRSVPPTRVSRSGGLGGRGCRAAVDGPQPEAGGHDVVRVVQDPAQAQILRHDHAQVDEAERAADRRHLGDRERETERDEHGEEPEAELRDTGQADLRAD